MGIMANLYKMLSLFTVKGGATDLEMGGGTEYLRAKRGKKVFG